jgi:hypothetical protein
MRLRRARREAMTCHSVRSNVGLCGSDPRSNDGQTIKKLLAFRFLKPVTWAFWSG